MSARIPISNRAKSEINQTRSSSDKDINRFIRTNKFSLLVFFISAFYSARGSPLRNPYIFKGQTNRVTKRSSTFRPTEHDFEKKLGGHFDSRLEIGFENA